MTSLLDVVSVPNAGYSILLSYNDVEQVCYSSFLLFSLLIVSSRNHVRKKIGIFNIGHMVQLR